MKKISLVQIPHVFGTCTNTALGFSDGRYLKCLQDIFCNLLCVLVRKGFLIELQHP